MIRSLATFTLLLAATVMAGVEIRGPRDVDALPASEPNQVASYGEHDLQFGELRLPEGDGPYPVAVVIHGGCWTAGFATVRNTAPLASALTERGIATWNIEYRQVGDQGAGWPGTFRDWAAAADHLRTLAAAHPLDLSRVFAIGHSAGGHAALWLAARHRLPVDSAIRGDNPLPIQAAVNIDGPADIGGFVGPDAEICGKPVIAPLMGGTPDEVPAHYAQGNPLALQPAGVPQYLIQVGVLSADDAGRFHERVRTDAAPVEILAPASANHFDIIAPGSTAGDAVLDWVVEKLGQTAPDATAQRRIVLSQADLPVTSYALAKSPSALLDDDAAFAVFADAVRDQLDALITGHDIRDTASLIQIYQTQRDLALLSGDAESARRFGATARTLEEKPSNKLLSGMLEDAAAATIDAGDAGAVVFRAHLDKTLAPLPWLVVANDIREMRSAAGMLGDGVIRGVVSSMIDPVHQQTGSISQPIANRLIRLQTYRKLILPHVTEQASALDAYIAANQIAKPDIWPERSVDLAGRDDLAPVIVAIWDSGIDAALFPGQLFMNPDEQPNGLDDDGNGFVDDIHGIAFEFEGERSDRLLFALPPEMAPRETAIRKLFKGSQDVQYHIDSAEAADFRARLATMTAEQFASHYAESSAYHNYAHGTHVAGIAIAGNPAARLLSARIEFPHQLVPPPFTRELALASAGNYQATVDYFKRHGVRVANMSWLLTPASIERTLEANNLGGTPEQRQTEALAIYRIMADALTAALASAPEILFVPAAGNTDDDVDFIQAIPAGIELPNVLTVGAVDRAGDEVAFTSYGRLVRAHANGYEIESLVPGGEALHWSGTSLAAPQVTNLAAKLFAVEPSLSAADVRQLVLDGAQRSDDGRRNLIHPRRSLDLLIERQQHNSSQGSSTTP